MSVVAPASTPESDALLAAIRAAEERVRNSERAILSAVESQARTAALDRIHGLRTSVRYLQVVLDQHGRAWLRNGLTRAYAEGAIAGGAAPFTWTQPHITAIQKIATATLDDLLRASTDAGRTSTAFASRVQEQVGKLAAGTLAQGTPTALAREMARNLEAGGLTGVVYADGSRHQVRDYMEMVTRTRTATAYNDADLTQIESAGIGWVEVFDGAGCGWESHDSPDKANGSVRPLDEARGFPIAHPACRRAFGARPDVTNHKQAKDAQPTTTAGQRADQKQAEQDRVAQQRSRAAGRTSQQFRNRVNARHATPVPDPVVTFDQVLARLPEAKLAERLAEVGDDQALLDQILAELDRRDVAEKAAKAAKVRRDAAREAKQATLDARYEQLISQGADPETAYADVFGVSEEQQRRDGAIALLRSSGYHGAGLDQLARQAFKDEAERLYYVAEEQTRGNVLNKAGRAAGVDPRALFIGREDTARKYASEELLQYWQDNGRLTFDNFVADLLGGRHQGPKGGYFA